jgi:hypothetical protein
MRHEVHGVSRARLDALARDAAAVLGRRCADTGLA